MGRSAGKGNSVKVVVVVVVVEMAVVFVVLAVEDTVLVVEMVVMAVEMVVLVLAEENREERSESTEVVAMIPGDGG